jgi:serine/threonine-protein kinase
MDDLVGMDETSAKNLLDSYDLGLNIVIEEEHSKDVEVGKVISTLPEEGAELNKNDNIILYISTGPEISISAMPNVIDKSQEMAINILESQKLNLDIDIEEVFDSQVQKGNVVKTDPAGGEQLKTGQKVTLFISKGPEMKVVPNVVGMDIDTAVSVLTKAGFKTPSIEYVESEEPKGTVLSQYPQGGLKLDVTTTVKLTISLGPEEDIPDVPTPEPDNSIQLMIPLELPNIPAEDCVLTIWNGTDIVAERAVYAGTISVELKLRGEGVVTFTAKLSDAANTTWSFQVDFTEDDLGT